MSHRAFQIMAAAVPALLLAGCTPPFIDKAYLPFAKDYYRSCERGRCPVPVETLSLDHLYAVHVYGGKYHHGTSRTAEFARRGGEAVPFLRGKLAAARNPGEIGGILDLFKAMRRAGTYEVREDPSLLAAIQAAAHRVKDPGYFLRDTADELETGEERPFSVSAVRKWHEGYGKDYDLAFARSHCRGCDFATGRPA